MKHLGQNRRIPISRRLLPIFDFLILLFSIVVSFWLAYGDVKWPRLGEVFLQIIFPSAICGLIIFEFIGLYRQLWRFATILQYIYLAAGTLLQTTFYYLIGLLFPNPPRHGYYVVFWMTSFILMTALRVAYRIIFNYELYHLAKAYHRFRARFHNRRAKENLTRVLIIGASRTASKIIREMRETRSGYLPVAIIDDDREKLDCSVMNVPVIGDRRHLYEAVDKYSIQEVIMAIPNAEHNVIIDYTEMCRLINVKLKIMPGIQDLIDGKISLDMIKDVAIEDLLGRQEIEFDDEGHTVYLKDKVVLVTGGGGSIGSELCRQIAKAGPKRLIIFDIYENNAFSLQHELLASHKDGLDLKILIGSVRDTHRLDEVFAQHKPDIVFHAAAHKHVPLMEDSPGEAVKNNIGGTYNVADAAGKFKCERFVLISTDKAVNPTNKMGATKRIAEMVIQTMNRVHPHTQYTAVRFGNVLGSNGSVIPIFKEQIRRDRKITVTHPDITRFFMTIPEASRLVIKAGSYKAQDRDDSHTYVLDMGEPVKILDLAKALILLSGLEVDRDVKIEFTGLRPGEKMYEELFYDKEDMTRTENEKIFKIKPGYDPTKLITELEELQSLIGWMNPEFDRITIWILEHQAKPQITMKPVTKKSNKILAEIS